MAEAGIGSREGKGPAVREGPAEHHSMSLPSICHGIPAKVFQVSLPAVHLQRRTTAKAFQVGDFVR